jgi:hypothetical protein
MTRRLGQFYQSDCRLFPPYLPVQHCSKKGANRCTAIAVIRHLSSLPYQSNHQRNDYDFYTHNRFFRKIDEVMCCSRKSPEQEACYRAVAFASTSTTFTSTPFTATGEAICFRPPLLPRFAYYQLEQLCLLDQSTTLEYSNVYIFGATTSPVKLIKGIAYSCYHSFQASSQSS